MEHKKYEYLILNLPFHIKTINQQEEWLNIEAQDGWELTAIDKHPERSDRYIFKRTIINNPS